MDELALFDMPDTVDVRRDNSRLLLSILYQTE